MFSGSSPGDGFKYNASRIEHWSIRISKEKSTNSLYKAKQILHSIKISFSWLHVKTIIVIFIQYLVILIIDYICLVEQYLLFFCLDFLEMLYIFMCLMKPVTYSQGRNWVDVSIYSTLK